MTTKPTYGAVAAIPDDVETAWGARLIWPDDLVWNRQDAQGPRAAELSEYLNGGPLRAALDKARELADNYAIRPDGTEPVVLYDDERVRIVANPQGSHGYLYVAAWFTPVLNS